VKIKKTLLKIDSKKLKVTKNVRIIQKDMLKPYIHNNAKKLFFNHKSMKTRELTDGERWWIISFLDANPNYSECSRKYGVSQSTVWNINKQEMSRIYWESGNPALNHQKIVEEIKNESASLRKIAGINAVWHSTVENYSYKAKLYFRRYEEIPALTDAHKKHRLSFCQKFKFSNFDGWVFVSEYNGSLDNWASHLYWEKNPNPALMIWAGISKHQYVLKSMISQWVRKNISPF